MEIIINIIQNYWSDEPICKSFGYTLFFGAFFCHFFHHHLKHHHHHCLLIGSIIKRNTGLCSSTPLSSCFCFFLRLFCFLIKRKCFGLFLPISIYLARPQSINNLELFDHNHHHCCDKICYCRFYCWGGPSGQK